MPPAETSVPPEPLALRPRQAARLLGLSERWLWALTQPRGPIPCARVGSGRRKTILYPLAALRDWLAAQTEPASHGEAGE